MGLNPNRKTLNPTILQAFGRDTPFRAKADAALAEFRDWRTNLVAQVRRGDITPKMAREQANQAAARLRERLLQKAESFSTAPSVFLDRVTEETDRRQRLRKQPSLEGLQRETAQLLQKLLIEQQITNRTREFEAQAHVRSVSGGPALPTLDSLLKFHDQATRADDKAGREWSRRQLEAFRHRTLSEQNQRRIDRACERPEQLNPRQVTHYVATLSDRPAEEREAFVRKALESQDASACAAAFAIARQAPEGIEAPWVLAVLENLKHFPDASLTAIHAQEIKARRDDAEAARTAAQYAAALAESDAKLAKLESPTEAEIERETRLQSRPIAQPHEPIGLNLQRRGLSSVEAGSPPSTSQPVSVA